MNKKPILAIIGSASQPSSNESLVNYISQIIGNDFQVTIFKDLKQLPHFDPELSSNNPPASIMNLRTAIEQADGIIICTPEYIFSIPSGLKNALEWCVATTIFQNKPLGIITASASGEKGHAELQLIMQTVMAKFNERTTLLVSGIRGKINNAGVITDPVLEQNLRQFVESLHLLVTT
jgi:NAD(P)H-dependent FMN reductase